MRLRVTEPPEPRRPSEDGGEDETDWDAIERDATREFVKDSTPDMQEAIDAARAEYGDEKFDEMVAEVLRRANRPNDNEPDPHNEEVPGTDEWFASVDDDMLLDEVGNPSDDEFPGDLDDERELRETLKAWRDDVDSVPIPTPATDAIARGETPTKGTSPVSASEGAARLLELSQNQYMVGALQEVQAQLENMKSQVQSALGEGHSEMSNALGPLQQAEESVAQLTGMIQSALGNLRDVAGRVG